MHDVHVVERRHGSRIERHRRPGDARRKSSWRKMHSRNTSSPTAAVDCDLAGDRRNTFEVRVMKPVWLVGSQQSSAGDSARRRTVTVTSRRCRSRRRAPARGRRMCRARRTSPSRCVFRRRERRRHPSRRVWRIAPSCAKSPIDLELLRREGHLVTRAAVHEPGDPQAQRALEADAPARAPAVAGECRRR